MNESISLTELSEIIASATKIDLSHVIEEGMPVYPTHPQYFHLEWHTGDPANLYQCLISEHAGTHMDSPAHFYGDRKDDAYLPVDQLSIERFFAKAMKLDFRGIDQDRELNRKDLVLWEEENVLLSQVDAVVFNFGWDKLWKQLSEGDDFTKAWPGINASAAEYLVEKGIRLVGTDCLGIDGSSTTDLGSHYVLLRDNIIILENLNSLDLLPTEFLIIALPLKIKDGSGSPARVVALF